MLIRVMKETSKAEAYLTHQYLKEQNSIGNQEFTLNRVVS